MVRPRAVRRERVGAICSTWRSPSCNRPDLRPGLHLVAAASEALFGAPLALALPNHRLVRAGVLEVVGDGPMPTRSLAVALELWALLCGDATARRDTAPLADGDAMLPQGFREQIPTLAASPAQRRHPPRRVPRRACGRTCRRRAPRRRGRAPRLHMEGRDQRAPARPRRRLPLCGLAAGADTRARPGERHILPEHPALAVPMLLVSGRDGAIEAPALIEIDLPPLSPRNAATPAPKPSPAKMRIPTSASTKSACAPSREHALLDGPSLRTLAGAARGLTPGARRTAQPRPPAPGACRLRKQRAPAPAAAAGGTRSAPRCAGAAGRPARTLRRTRRTLPPARNALGRARQQPCRTGTRGARTVLRRAEAARHLRRQPVGHHLPRRADCSREWICPR